MCKTPHHAYLYIIHHNSIKVHSFRKVFSLFRRKFYGIFVYSFLYVKFGGKITVCNGENGIFAYGVVLAYCSCRKQGISLSFVGTPSSAVRLQAAFAPFILARSARSGIRKGRRNLFKRHKLLLPLSPPLLGYGEAVCEPLAYARVLVLL